MNCQFAKFCITCAIRSLPGGMTGSCLFLGDPCGVMPDPERARNGISPESLLPGEYVLCGGLLERNCEDDVADMERLLIGSLSRPRDNISDSAEANRRLRGLASRRDLRSKVGSSGGGLQT
jgi:hypothetical protein